LASLVKRMLAIHQELRAATSSAAQARIEREIHVTDEQIDALIYELYSLTDDEIKIVEGAA
jgi:type II restriction/modification system DNA methylase subunit YeeA